jgi:glycosyltransferase involved in cell wall biosynthesis
MKKSSSLFIDIKFILYFQGEKMTEKMVTFIILTLNEEHDLDECLKSVEAGADIIVVDSFSNDKTLDIASEYTNNIYQNKWVSFAKQREWAMQNTRINTEWVMFIDADERLTKLLIEEIYDFILSNPKENGCYIRRRFIFGGKWLKHGGYYPCSELRLMRKSKVQFLDEGGGARERFLIDGEKCELKEDMFHVYDKSFQHWISKHSKLALLEAKYSNSGAKPEVIEGLGIKVWIRTVVWENLPGLFRPFLLFIYRYIIRLGILDGKMGFYYCFLHDLWYPILVDFYSMEEA